MGSVKLWKIRVGSAICILFPVQYGAHIFMLRVTFLAIGGQ